MQQLRYRCYLEEGAIDSNEDERLTDEFDLAANTMIFGIYDSAGLVASIRLQVLTMENSGSPTTLAFPEIVAPLLSNGKRLLDPTRFVISSAASRQYRGLAYYVLWIPFCASMALDIDVALAAVRPEHMPFYRRTLNYRKAAPPRPYLKLRKPLGLMVADFKQERSAVLEKHPFFGWEPDDPTLFKTTSAHAC